MTFTDFTILTGQKGNTFNGRKITNNSTQVIFYKGEYVGEVRTKKNATAYIANLVEHQRLEYTP